MSEVALHICPKCKSEYEAVYYNDGSADSGDCKCKRSQDKTFDLLKAYFNGSPIISSQARIALEETRKAKGLR